MQRWRRRTNSGAGDWLSGLWHQAQQSGQPFMKTVVRTPGPSWSEKRCTLKTRPVRIRPPGTGGEVVRVDEALLDREGPVDVLQVCRGLVDRAAFEQGEKVLVLDDGVLLPGLHHRLAAGPVVQPLLQEVDLGDEARVVAAPQVDVVEREVGLVVAIEVARGDGVGHRRVELAHAGEVGRAERRADAAERGRFEGADDLVEVTDVVEGEGVEAEPAARKDGDEALRLEVEERLAQRRAADAEAGGKLVEVEECAGLQAAAGHFGSQVVVDLLPEGAGLEAKGVEPGDVGPARTGSGYGIRHQISNISDPGAIGVRPGSDPSEVASLPGSDPGLTPRAHAGGRRTRAMLRAKEYS